MLNKDFLVKVTSSALFRHKSGCLKMDDVGGMRIVDRSSVIR